MPSSYNNPLGSGYREQYIVVTPSTGLSGGGTWSRLVNGVIADAPWFSGAAAAGKSLQFDFGLGNRFIITEAKFYQSGTNSHGTWKWQASNNGTDWTDIGGNFTLGGATTQTLTELSGNTTAYRYYRIYGVSGNTSNSPYLREFEFNIGEVQTSGPSYLYLYGTGGRSSLITVTATNNYLYQNKAQTLVDGLRSDVTYLSSTAVSGKYIAFDFGSGKVVVEAAWAQSLTTSHGTWKWQGSNNNSDWFDIGAEFTLGGATYQTQTQLSGNTTSYRYYRLLGVSGNSSNSPFVYELDFKLAIIPGDWQPPVPPEPPNPGKGGNGGKGGGKGGGASKKDVQVFSANLGSRPVVVTFGVELFAPLYVLAAIEASGGTAAGAAQAGSAAEIFAGTGAAVAEAGQSGAGAEVFVGDDGATAAAAGQSGNGAVVFAGTGDVAAVAAQSGSGAEAFSGSGSTAAEATCEGSSPEETASGGGGGRIPRREARWRPQSREQYLPQARPTLVAAGGMAAEAERSGAGGLVLVGAGRSRAAAAMQASGGVVFGGGGGLEAAARMRGRGSVDNTIPDEDEELILMLAA